MKFKFFLVLVAIAINLPTSAQSSSGLTNLNSYMPVVPQSPDVASLMKYKETPVSKNSGIPEINIPIYNIEVDGVSIPVSLNYHSAGVRVNEIAPWTGQGWNLMAGGSITRTVRHLSDDHQYGYIWTPITTQDIYDSCVMGLPDISCQIEITRELLGNRLDFEPDVFNYNAPGISGKFMFNQINNHNSNLPRELNSFPLSNNKIKAFFYGKKITSWIITDTQGNRFFFEMGNVLKSTSGSTVESIGNLPLADDFGPSSPEYTETWDLAKIVTVNGQVVKFKYLTTSDCLDCTFSGQSIGKLGETRGNLKTTYIQAKRNFTEIESIVGPFGRINFNKSEVGREDFPAGESLSEIEIRDLRDSLIKRFDLKYSYTQGAYPNSYIYGCKESTPLYNPINEEAYKPYTKRMFLDEIQVFGMLGVSDSEPSDSYKYVFDYYNGHILPHRNSYAQDFWGYYNGANNKTLLFDNPGNYFTDRLINQEYAITGLLKSMHYPEGGHTRYTYESNRASVVSGYFAGHRLVPYDEKSLEFDTDVDSPEEVINPTSGRTEFIYEKALILDGRTFNLDNFPFSSERRALFESIIDSRNSNGETICIVEDTTSLPTDNQCSFYLRVYKTNLNPADYPDESYIVIEDLEWDDYDHDFTLNELLGPESRKTYVPTGVYIMQLVLYKGSNLGNQSEQFNLDEDRAQVSIKYKVAKEEINFSDDYQRVEIPVGGQRIVKIEDFTADNILAKTREFNYVLENSINTSGNILRIPHFYSKVNGAVSETSLPAVSLITTAAGNVSYTRVVEDIVDFTNSISKQSIVSSYRYPPLLPVNNDPMKPFMNDYRYGQETSVEIPSKKLTTTGYTEKWIEINSNPSTFHHGVLPPTSYFPYRYQIGGSGNMQFIDMGGEFTGDTFYQIQYGHTRMSFQEDITYVHDNVNRSVVNKSFYKYDNPEYYQPSSVETVIGDEKRMIQKFYYPYDLIGVEPFAQTLLSNNRFATPILAETHMMENGDESLLMKNRKTYKIKRGNLLPDTILSSKGDNLLEPRIVFHDYDVHGNPTDILKVGGGHTSYIWGYGGQHLIAKIDNASYAQSTASNLDLDFTIIDNPSSAQQLRDEINKIRTGLPTAQVTTYTYEPLIGVSSVTDPKGYTIRYEYDGLGRLKYVKDMEGNVLSENQYHYKND